jgi:hypothetical protein
MVRGLSEKSKRRRAQVTYSPVEADPKPFRSWLHDDCKRPGPPKTLPPGSVVRLMPDYLGDLPVWGLDWQNPPLSRELLKLLVAWQDDFDDHSDGNWPPEDWDRWVSEGKRLANLLRWELGPSVVPKIDPDLEDRS